jgi:RimJ/RimL family protein N-acetyltransferase
MRPPGTPCCVHRAYWSTAAGGRNASRISISSWRNTIQRPGHAQSLGDRRSPRRPADRQSAGFHSLDLPHRRAELAYDVGVAHWGQGIGTLVARALSEFGLTQLGYRRVQATVLDSNLASRRVLEKAGFTYEGLLHHYRLVRGEPRDFLSYARWA